MPKSGWRSVSAISTEQDASSFPNAWDGASARIFAKAGFPAIGTTSASIAYSRGFRDGQQISREAMMQEVRLIANSVEVPVSADIEAGYGLRPSEVARSVEAVIEAGAVGVNLEDNAHGVGIEPLVAVHEQVARIAAARDAAKRLGVPLVINARTDTYLAGEGADERERRDLTIERGQAYLSAGADLVFVPLLIDPEVVRQLAAAMQGSI